MHLEKLWLHFRGKTAVITGAASGIGLGLAKVLWQAGAHVVMTDLNQVQLEEARGSFGRQTKSVSIYPLDVRDREAFLSFAQKLKAQGQVDLLFNNAGIGLAGEVRDMELIDWEKLIQVNLWGVIHGIEAFYPLMITQGSGHIVNTASGAGILPRPGMAAYAATKHAVLGLSISLRGEADGWGVKVSTVCPGYIATNILNSTTYKNVDVKKMLAKVPFKPMSPEVCAQVILTGVLKNKAIIPVTQLTAWEWRLFRLMPNSMSDWEGKLRGKNFKAHRLKS